MSSPAPEFPPVDPTNFDLIIIGTGLPESIISAASSSAGKSVLHLDPNPFYGSNYSSLSPPEFSSFLQSSPPSSPSSHTSDEFDTIPLSSHSLYSDVEISSNELENPRKFCFDVSGPRVLFCADSAINLMLKTGVCQYLEFKSIDWNLIYDGVSKNLGIVPDSRAAIFKDRSFSLTEKNQMMRLFKLVQQHLERGAGEGEGEGVFSKEDLECPFVEFLTKMRLPQKIKSMILYAIAMADYDQEDIGTCKDLLKTKDGIDRLTLYILSIGRFPNAQGAMLYPMYGQGELPQAFCRRAAVKGCIYVLRMPVSALLVEKCSGLYKGVKLASGQDIFSQKLIMDPHLIVGEGSSLSQPSSMIGISQDSGSKDPKKKVARAICVTKTSLKSNSSNLLIVCPPKSLYPEQATSVRILQLGDGVAVCPVGMFVLHLSAICDDTSQGKKLLTAAINSLFRQPVSGTSESSLSENTEVTSGDQSAEVEKQKPTLLWSALYIQEISEGSVDTISTGASPDANLSYNDLINVTEKMFKQMYPDLDFFPETSSSEDHEDGDDGNIDPE